MNRGGVYPHVLICSSLLDLAIHDTPLLRPAAPIKSCRRTDSSIGKGRVNASYLWVKDSLKYIDASKYSLDASLFLTPLHTWTWVHECTSQVFQEESLRQGSAKERARFVDVATKADVFVGSAIQDPSTAEFVAKVIEEADVKTRFSAGCPPELARTSLLGRFRPDPPAPLFVRILPDFLRDFVGGENSGTKKDRVLWNTLNGFYERNSSEDLTFLSLVLVDS